MQNILTAGALDLKHLNQHHLLLKWLRTAAKGSMERGMKTVEVSAKGPGSGRRLLFVHYKLLD